MNLTTLTRLVPSRECYEMFVGQTSGAARHGYRTAAVPAAARAITDVLSEIHRAPADSTRYGKDSRRPSGHYAASPSTS